MQGSLFSLFSHVPPQLSSEMRNERGNRKTYFPWILQRQIQNRFGRVPRTEARDVFWRTKFSVKHEFCAKRTSIVLYGKWTPNSIQWTAEIDSEMRTMKSALESKENGHFKSGKDNPIETQFWQVIPPSLLAWISLSVVRTDGKRNNSD